MQTIDLSTATVRDLNQALHGQAIDSEWRVTHSNGKHNLAAQSSTSLPRNWLPPWINTCTGRRR